MTSLHRLSHFVHNCLKLLKPVQWSWYRTLNNGLATCTEGVIVDGVFLGFQTTCSLVINSLDAVECPGGSTDANDNLGGIVGGVMAAVLLLILVGVAIVTLIVFYIKKQCAIIIQKRQAGNR